jgi:hypothetical protein
VGVVLAGLPEVTAPRFASLRIAEYLVRAYRTNLQPADPLAKRIDVRVGSFAAGSAETACPQIPLCINTDRKFWALGFVWTAPG